MAGLFKFGFTNSNIINGQNSNKLVLVVQKKRKSDNGGDDLVHDAKIKSIKTVNNWQKQTGEDPQRPDLRWLRYDSEDTTDGKVKKVWCVFCRRKPDIVRKCNQFAGLTSDLTAYVEGTTNIKKTNCERHAGSQAHEQAKGI